METIEEKFENPPLKSVSCEIRFPTSLKIMDKIPDFQEIIRNDFPNYFTQNIPVASKFGIVDELWWNFKSEVHDLILSVKNNLIVLQSNEYIKFSLLYKYVNDYFGAFFDKNNIDKFSRIGLRYINREDFNEKVSNLKQVLEYFNLIYVNIDENEKVDKFNIRFNKKEGNYFINIINNYGKQSSGTYSFIFDYDCYHLGDSNKKNYLSILNDLHINILKAFRKNISEKYIEELKRRI